MRYEPIPAKVYKQNRDQFAKHLKPKSLAVFNSNDIYPVSADSELPFAQHRDMFHLAGIDQEETILILYPSSKDSKTREVLFIRRSDEHTKIWEGEKLSKDLASKLSGIESIHFVEDFKNILHLISSKVDTFYINKNEHYRANSPVETREDRFISWLLKKYPAHKVAKSNPKTIAVDN